MKEIISVMFIGAYMFVVSASQAQGVLTFDNLATELDPTFHIYQNAVPNEYGGLLWDGFWAYDVVNQPFPEYGYVPALVSPNDVIFNVYGAPATVSSTSGSFSLNSAYVTASIMDGLEVEARGYLGSTLLYDKIYSVNPTTATLVNFDYVGVDRVLFTASGGTVHPGWEINPPNSVFIIDNMSVTIPEPSAVSLVVASALLGLATSKTRSKAI